MTLALAALAVLPLLAAAELPPPPSPTPAPPAVAVPGAPRSLRVLGEGRVSVRPDVAIVHAGVEATGKDLAQVSAEAAARMRGILRALEKAGIAERDVTTTRHDVSVERPWTDRGPGPITGYTVSDEVRIRVRDLSRLGLVLERVVAAGSNTLRGLSFVKDDPTPEQAGALARAYAAARVKAEALARAAGVTLGEVLAASEAGGGPPVVPLQRMALKADAEGAPVSPGELEITASVEVIFAVR